MPLARLGFEVTVLDPSAAMLAKAEQRLRAEPDEVRRRVRLIEASGEQAPAATGGQQFAAVLCHGVLMYVEHPEPLVQALCRCTRPGGIVSVMALNARTLAVRPALELAVWTSVRRRTGTPTQLRTIDEFVVRGRLLRRARRVRRWLLRKGTPSPPSVSACGNSYRATS